MYNNNLILQATKLVEEYYASIMVTVDRNSIVERIQGWYCHSDIADAEILAAAAILGDYDPAIKYDTLVEATEFYFYKLPIEYSDYINTQELKEAAEDENFLFET